MKRNPIVFFIAAILVVLVLIGMEIISPSESKAFHLITLYLYASVLAANLIIIISILFKRHRKRKKGRFY